MTKFEIGNRVVGLNNGELGTVNDIRQDNGDVMVQWDLNRATKASEPVELEDCLPEDLVLVKGGLYLIEYYACGGDYIRFAWVVATNGKCAKSKLASRFFDDHGLRVDFEEVISCEPHAYVSELALGEGEEARCLLVGTRE